MNLNNDSDHHTSVMFSSCAVLLIVCSALLLECACTVSVHLLKETPVLFVHIVPYSCVNICKTLSL